MNTIYKKKSQILMGNCNSLFKNKKFNLFDNFFYYLYLDGIDFKIKKNGIGCLVRFKVRIYMYIEHYK